MRWIKVAVWLATVAAAFGLGMAVERWGNRRAEYLAKADFNEGSAHIASIRTRDGGEVVLLPKEMFGADGRMKEEQARMLDRRRDYFASLGRKYRLAAAYPWLAVEADAPAP